MDNMKKSKQKSNDISSSRKLENFLYKRDNDKHRCSKCGGASEYSVVEGSYTCKKCGNVENDTYGKVRNLLEKNPNMSRMELTSALHISLREVNSCFEGRVLTNPKISLLDIEANGM